MGAQICRVYILARVDLRARLVEVDDDAAPSAQAPQQWACPLCTLVNDAARQRCGACGEPAPPSSAVGCGLPYKEQPYMDDA